MEYNSYRFYTCDVFTDRIFGGNQLAVFPQAQGLSSAQMQQIAKEFNLSETVFVFPAESPKHHRRLRIFTPATELPFAGHPTVGSAYTLAAIGEIQLTGDETTIVLEEEVGPVKVKIRAKAGQPTFAELTAAKLPQWGPTPPPVDALASVLSLEPADLLTEEMTPQAVSCGVPFLFIPLRNRQALQRIQLNKEQWRVVLQDYWASQMYVITADPELATSDLRARMFAPSMGIEEDPATGAAATALAGYLATYSDQQEGTLRWVVEQGFEIQRPSLLYVEADRQQGEIVQIRVGGASVLVSDGTMRVAIAP